jgi:hypothetical protein
MKNLKWKMFFVFLSQALPSIPSQWEETNAQFAARGFGNYGWA